MIRLAVRVRREAAELVLAELLELAPSGVEEREVGGCVEYAVYGTPGELPQLPDLRAAVGEELVEVATTELPDDWSERWKRFHRPVLIESVAGERLPASVEGPESVSGLYVRPPWEAPCGRSDVEEIVIDPGQAFGTGAHATTRLCLELLMELAAATSPRTSPRGEGGAGSPLPGVERGPLVDVGTGSGVLAIAAARLGYAPVVALDLDPESVAAAAANAAANGVAIEVARFDLRHERVPARDSAPPPVVLANLLRPLLLDLPRALACAPADVIVGGLLREEVEEVVGALGERLGLRERERRARGEWAAAWLSRAAYGVPTSAAPRGRGEIS